MGIYGQGQAFNLSCQPRQVSLPAQRRTPPPQVNCNHTTVIQVGAQSPQIMMPTMPVLAPIATPVVGQNVTINNSGGGWKSFLGGFLGGIAGGIAGNAISPNTDAKGTQATTDNTDKLKNLKTLFPSNAFVDNGDGTFTCRANNEMFTGTYDEMLSWLNEKSQGTSTTGSTGSTETTPTTETTSEEDTTSGTETTPPSGGTRGSSGTRRSGSSGKVHVPDGWYRASNTNEKNIKGLLTEGTTPRQVLDKVLKSKCDYLSDADRNALAAELEKSNPSIFKDGKVKQGADISKLDIPSTDYIKNKYAHNTKKVANGIVSYKDKNGKTQVQASNINAKGAKTIQGQNGYKVVYTNNKATFYKPNGEKTTEKDFYTHCPNIYNSLPKDARSKTVIIKK